MNPKPVGEIHSTGHFGPWQDEPRDTPVDGGFSFTQADLGTIKGISGTLSSSGTYRGRLGEIGVTGTTDTPNFALDVSEHPMDLKTVFDATVDGTTGDTRLNSVRASFLETVLQVSGMVIRAGRGVCPRASPRRQSGHGTRALYRSFGGEQQGAGGRPADPRRAHHAAADEWRDDFARPPHHPAG